MVVPPFSTCLNRYLAGALLVLLAILLFGPLSAAAQQPKLAFIRLAASNEQVYVQQQLILTVTLTYSDQVIRGELSAPEHPDALIEQLGRQREYRERINGESYRVVERRYAIFPQKPGQLQLSDVTFEGLARHPRGHVMRLADSARLFDVKVLDVPPEFSGDTWLPARNLTMSGRGLEGQQQVRPGDNLTRTLTVAAEGLPATVLPPLENQYPVALRPYPEPAARNSSVSPDGITGVLEQTIALVPVPDHSGAVLLPEIRIPWWDVEADEERVAVLPARELTLAGQSLSQNPEDVGPDPAEDNQTSSPTPEPDPGTMGYTHWLWPLALTLLATGWAATVAAWWWQARRRGRRPEKSAGGQGPENSEIRAFQLTRAKAGELDPAFFRDFPHWVALLTGQPCVTTREALARLANGDLTTQVNDWQRCLFHPSGSVPPNARELARNLKAVRKDWCQKAIKGGRGHRRTALPRFYPEGIEPGDAG